MVSSSTSAGIISLQQKAEKKKNAKTKTFPERPRSTERTGTEGVVQQREWETKRLAGARQITPVPLKGYIFFSAMLADLVVSTGSFNSEEESLGTGPPTVLPFFVVLPFSLQWGERIFALCPPRPSFSWNLLAHTA